MKKAICLVLIFGLLFSFFGCHKYKGDVSEVKTRKVESKLYSQEDIDAAIAVIIEEFRSWQGCKLTEIYYAGDETNQQENAYYIKGGVYPNAQEMIVLESSFEVDESGGDGSLNPNTTYNHWKWLLVREDGGTWEHVDHGYG